MLLKDDFVERTKSKVFFYIESTIWNNIDHKRLISWLNQFNEETEEEIYLAYLLLDSLVYYNKSDCLKLLSKGIFDLVIREIVLRSDKQSDFRKNELELKDLIKGCLSRVGFMTLLTDGDNETTVSSRVLTRYLTHEMDFSEDQVFDPSDLETVYDKFDIIILVDDFIGSGRQIINFWYHTEISFKGSQKLISDVCLENSISMKYLCLVADEKGLANFYGDGDKLNLQIWPCESLNKSHGFFEMESDRFESTEDCEKYKRIYTEVCDRNGIKSFGYELGELTIAFEHTLPDSTLPIFWEHPESYLVRNKKTKRL